MRDIGNWLRSFPGLRKKGIGFPFDVIQATLKNTRTNELREPYRHSVWVQRAIKKIAGPIASVPLRFTNGEDGAEIEDPRIDEFFRAPAIGLTFSDFIEATVGWLSLAGEAFWIKDDIWLTQTTNLPFPETGLSMPQLYVARPDHMKEVEQDGRIIGWEFLDTKGRKHALLPEQVCHLKHWNPYSDWRGLGPYESAACAAEADNFACNFNRNLWRNNGDRGPIVTAEDATIEDSQRKQIVEQLRMKREAGLRGDFKPIFLTGKIDVKDPQIQALDANAVATRLQNRHEIALAFGVPPSMFDVMASYSIGSASDRFVLIEETCMPMAEKIADKLQDVAVALLGQDGIVAYFDWDEHSTMQAVRRERLDSAMKLWAAGMPMEQISEYLRLGINEYEGWDIGYLPFSVTPVGEERDQTLLNEESDADDDSEDETEDEERSAINGVRKLLSQRNGNGSDFQASRPKKERQLWLSHMAKRQKIVKAYEVGFTRVLMAARSETLKRLSEVDASQPKAITGKGIGDMVFDLSKFKRALWLTMRNVNRKALDDAGQQVMDELEIDDPWATPAAEVIEYNRIRENKIVGAADDIFRDINSTIEDGINKGQSISDISNSVRQQFNGISKGRAKRIAMTETAAAYGRGRESAMEQAGVEYKQWVTSGLGNVRPAHQEANGQVVAVNETFSVGGEALRHPGDPSGSAGNVINCHCVSIAVPTKDGI